MQKVGALVDQKMTETGWTAPTSAARRGGAGRHQSGGRGCTKQQDGSENLRRQLKTYLDEATAAKNEASDLKRQLFKAQQRSNNNK